MKLKLSTKLFAGFLAISVLFAAVVIINYQLSRKVLRNSLRVEESQLRTEEATTLLRNIIDMETGFRGYMLVGNEAMLEPYHIGERNLLGRFVNLRQQMPPDSPQRGRLERAQHLFQQWASYSHLMISEKREALRRNPYQVALEGLEHKLLAEGLTGKMLMDQIRALFDGFEADELAARLERRDKLTDSIQQTRMLSISLTIIAITMGIVWATYITRLLAQRIAMMLDLSRRVAGGDYQTQLKDTDQDELSELVTSLNMMARTIGSTITQLERRNNELDQFAYVVSHDLKAPLRGIESASRWIEEDLGQELPDHIREFLQLMRTRVHRMENLISGILELARVGRTAQAQERVNVREFLTEIIDSLAPPAGFKVDLPSYLPTLITNRVQLQQVFTNLISNAFKYHDHPDTGTVRISCREDRQQYTFSIADDGPGIDPEYHERIFVIFQTLTDRDTLESTGVGLAIVKKIVERQGGTIQVESAEGQGAIFTFTWPKLAVAEASRAIETGIRTA
ncbi:histidine kinase [Hymenobacter roseosalivarius DSM 11622]|uniref:histidine kinase n=1 Tax=Hymenobacter roseosalivarius DSM 11622 TaxID=645990 RepID=A0A1W1VVB7_9BACT|nr:ATP-binding protein [Hymenobacter roseosalivarius]SMB97322.1 histidine kinase [Hymenobacter roseosalivarius DSM 11622]